MKEILARATTETPALPPKAVATAHIRDSIPDDPDG
jgi:hypothetical protein